MSSDEQGAEEGNPRGNPDGNPSGNSTGGRPRKDPRERRSLTHGLRLSPNEKEELEERAEEAGLSLSAYLRRCGLGKPMKTQIEKKALKEINKVGVNLNQLARWANQGKGRAVESEIEDAIRELKWLIRDLRR
jgi:hypothetical protein